MDLPKITCTKCKHTWIPRVETPTKCNKCGHIVGARVYQKKEKNMEIKKENGTETT